MKFLFLLSSFLLFASASEAYIQTQESACSTVDFRKTFPLKMRNQNELAWCYAHAASDYLQFTYQLDEQVSAADIAINYSQSKWSKFVTFFRNTFNRSLRNEPAQTGLIKYAVQMIIPQGYCPESSLPSDEWARIQKDGTSSKVEILQAALDLFNLQADVKSGSIKSPSELPWRYDFKNIRSANAFYDLLRSSTRKNILLRLRAQACTPDRRAFPEVPIQTRFRLKGPRVFSRINDSFDRIKAPVTIDFFSDILKHYDQPRISINNLHTVLVYGREFDPIRQECHFMIKDSYGEQCTKYDPQIKCDGGYVWLPESKLYKTLFSTFMMSRK